MENPLIQTAVLSAEDSVCWGKKFQEEGNDNLQKFTVIYVYFILM